MKYEEAIDEMYLKNQKFLEIYGDECLLGFIDLLSDDFIDNELRESMSKFISVWNNKLKNKEI